MIRAVSTFDIYTSDSELRALISQWLYQHHNNNHLSLVPHGDQSWIQKFRPKNLSDYSITTQNIGKIISQFINSGWIWKTDALSSNEEQLLFNETKLSASTGL